MGKIKEQWWDTGIYFCPDHTALTEKSGSFVCSPPLRLRNDSYECQRKGSLSNLPMITFVRYNVYFRRFRQCPEVFNLRSWKSHSF